MKTMNFIITMTLIIQIAQAILEIIKKWQDGRLDTESAVEKVAAKVAAKTKVKKDVAIWAAAKVMPKYKVRTCGLYDEGKKALNLINLIREILEAIVSILSKK